jgi:hypothetical protein
MFQTFTKAKYCHVIECAYRCVFRLVIRFIELFDKARDYTLQFTITHSDVFNAVAWQRLLTADVSIPLGSELSPDSATSLSQ